MGDCRQHDIRLERVLPLEPRKLYPVCIAGAGDCPPEDSGGPAPARRALRLGNDGVSAHRCALGGAAAPR